MFFAADRVSFNYNSLKAGLCTFTHCLYKNSNGTWKIKKEPVIDCKCLQTQIFVFTIAKKQRMYSFYRFAVCTTINLFLYCVCFPHTMLATGVISSTCYPTIVSIVFIVYTVNGKHGRW